MSTEIQRLPSPTPDTQELATMERVAEHLAKSGMFKDAQQATQAFAKISLGRGLGLDPASSMTAIHIVEGKPELSANLQAAMLRQYRGPDGERYDYRVKRLDREGCELLFIRRTPDGSVEEIGVSSFDKQDAEQAGLFGRRGPWQTYPKNMFFARAVSNGVAWFAPEVTYGMRVYSDGEIDPSREMHTAVLDIGEPEPPAIERATRDEYAALAALRASLTIDDELYAAMLDDAGIDAGGSLKDRLRNATRQQVQALTDTLRSLEPEADDEEQVQDAEVVA